MLDVFGMPQEIPKLLVVRGFQDAAHTGVQQGFMVYLEQRASTFRYQVKSKSIQLPLPSQTLVLEISKQELLFPQILKRSGIKWKSNRRIEIPIRCQALT